MENRFSYVVNTVAEVDICLRGWQLQVSSGFNPSHFLLSLFDVRLGTVIHVKTHKRHQNAQALDGMDGLIKPDDGNTDDGYTLDK